MVKDWISFFNLTGDPFSLTPLRTVEEFKQLFVKTDDITKQIDPLIEHFDESAPFIRVIAAPRGSGKSTILHYLSNTLRNKGILVCEISHTPEVLIGEPDPAFGIGNDTISKIVNELAEKLLETTKDREDRPKLIQFLNSLGLTVSHDVTDLKPMPSIYYSINRKRLEELLKFFKRINLRGFLAIDNYDKLDEERAIRFLSSNFSQPLFEELQAAGISIVLTADLEWCQKIGEKDLSYLGEPIILKPLNPLEALTLVQRRIASKSKGEPEKIFEDGAIFRIALREEGIARYIQETCKLCMMKAAQRNIRIIDENFVQDLIRSHERTASKYYEIIKPDPIAVGGLRVLSSLARESDPDAFRSLLYGIVDIMEGRRPNPEILDQLRRYKIVYLSERDVEPENLKNFLASEIKTLLDAIGRKFPLVNFMDWLSAGEIAVLYVPAPEEKKTDSIIEEQFNLLLPVFKREDIKLLLTGAHVSYKAWASQIEQGDYDYVQILSDMWASLWGLAVCAYYSYKVVKEHVFETPKPSYEEIENFLLSLDETRKLVPDFATVRNYHIYAEKGVPIEPSLLENIHPRALKLVSSLLELCMMSLPYLRELRIPLPSFRVKDAEELDNKLMTYFKTDDRYMYVFINDLPPSNFLMISWPFKNYIYSMLFAKDEYVKEFGLDLYELRNILIPKIPHYIQKQISVQGLSNGKLLRHYNTLEFCSSALKIAKKHVTYLKIYTHKVTVNVALAAEKDSIIGSIHFSSPKYGTKINLSDSYSSFYETEIKEKRPKLFISYSHADEGFVKKLVQDLKKEGIDVWIDFQEMGIGDSIIEKINKAIEESDYLAVVLSPTSVSSDWVKKEVSAGLMKEFERKSVTVLPIIARRCKVPPMLSYKICADFSENYQKGLRELLTKLKASS